MTLTQLSYLIALDNARHFRRAAAQLGISQPSLSNQLVNLEKELGVQLFDRSKKPIEPTLVGEQVIAQARTIMGESQRMQLIVEGMKGEMAGIFSIGIESVLCSHLVPGVLRTYAAAYPQVSLQVAEKAVDQIIHDVYQGRLDAGIITGARIKRGFIEENLYEEPLVCYVSKDHRLFDKEEIALDDLRLNDMWLPASGMPLREKVIQLCRGRRGRKAPHDKMEVASRQLEVLKRLVEAGKKMVIVPASMVKKPHVFEDELIRLFKAPAPTLPVSLIYAKTFLREQLVKALSKQIKEQYPI